MENPDQEIAAFLSLHTEFVQKHQKALALELSKFQSDVVPGAEITLDARLDDDLKAAFNAVSDHPTQQLMILQTQTIRLLRGLSEEA